METINTNLIEQTVELLERLEIYNEFIGVDISLNESLTEYGFIHSDKYGLSLFINEVGKLDGLSNWNTEQLIEAYKDSFDNWANLEEFLDFMGCDAWSDLSGDLCGLVLGFNQYYGIQESIFSGAYIGGFDNIEEVTNFITGNLKQK